MEPVTGIEPVHSDYKTDMLPLTSYRLKSYGDPRRNRTFVLSLEDSCSMPLNYGALNWGDVRDSNPSSEGHNLDDYHYLNNTINLVGVVGFEPTLNGPKPLVLPLNTIPRKMVVLKGIEPLSSGCKPDVLAILLKD